VVFAARRSPRRRSAKALSQKYVRAMILSVIRFNIAAAKPTRSIEKRWDAYRKQNSVDLYGKAVR
jgi:hypothetical protein